MGYGQLLGKTAVKLLLIILPSHPFKLNIFWVTYNQELKPLEGISETRYTENNYLSRCKKSSSWGKKCYQTERNWVLLLRCLLLSRREREARRERALPFLAQHPVSCSSTLTRISAAKKQEEKEKPSFPSDPAAASGPCYLAECTKRWK